MLLSLTLFFGSIISGWQHPLQVERLELRTGYAIARNDDDHPTGFQTVPLLPSAVIPLTDTVGPPHLRGRIEWAPELFLASFTYPYARPLLGANFFQFRYEFEPKGRWTPYVIGSFGVLHAKVDRQETGSDFNFNVESGLGARYAMTDSAALALEYRHIHISNSNLDENNSGIDSETILAGLSIKL